MTDRKYHLVYSVERCDPPVTKDEAEPGAGLTDALIVGSILYNADGSVSYALASVDGRTGADLSFDEIFQFWSYMALQLSMKLPPGNRRDLCDNVFKVVQRAVVEAAEKKRGST